MIKFNRKFHLRKIKLLIFELDGTLIDSRLDQVHSVNAMLRHFGRPELPGDVIVAYVGTGAPMLDRRALGDPKDERFLGERGADPAVHVRYLRGLDQKSTTERPCMQSLAS